MCLVTSLSIGSFNLSSRASAITFYHKLSFEINWKPYFNSQGLIEPQKRIEVEKFYQLGLNTPEEKLPAYLGMIFLIREG